MGLAVIVQLIDMIFPFDNFYLALLFVRPHWGDCPGVVPGVCTQRLYEVPGLSTVVSVLQYHLCNWQTGGMSRPGDLVTVVVGPILSAVG